MEKLLRRPIKANRSPDKTARVLVCGRYRLPLGSRTLVMGILNVTPDSFYDGGRSFDVGHAVSRALQMQEEGADLIDVGGESTRPGAAAVSAAEEKKRILPVIERLSRRLHIPISVDTSKASVAQAAFQAGASLVNDVTGLRDPKMASVVAQAKLPVILMHTRGTPKTMRALARYKEAVPEIIKELQGSIRKALSAGIDPNQILIDPGIGFAKGPKESLKVIKHLSAFKALGFPVVAGPSRKSFLGQVTGSDAGDRLFGTAAAVALCALNGADMVRVHDVAAMRDVVEVTQAVVGSS